MLNRDRLRNVFYDMVKIYSPSRGEGDICAWVMNYLEARGLEPSVAAAALFRLSAVVLRGFFSEGMI